MTDVGGVGQDRGVDGGRGTDDASNGAADACAEAAAASEATRAGIAASAEMMNDVARSVGRVDPVAACGTQAGPVGVGPTVEAAALMEANPGLDPAEALAAAAGVAGQAGVGYRAAMYGEVGVGPWTAQVGPSMRFGRFASESTLTQMRFSHLGIDDFARSDFYGHMARNTMASSQAAFNYAHATATNLEDVRFEATTQQAPSRTYDVHTGRGAPYTEIKAGQSISARQLQADIAAARGGLLVDYRFAGNPITGNHGPTPSVTARLADAHVQSGGNLTYGVTDIAASRASIEAVESAAHVSRAARAFGRVAAPVGLAADAYSIGSAIQADGGTFGRNATIATAGTVGGWAGAAAGGWGGAQVGAAVGAVGGPAGVAVGAVVGGLVGAVGGAFFGGWGAESAATAVTG